MLLLLTKLKKQFFARLKSTKNLRFFADFVLFIGINICRLLYRIIYYLTKINDNKVVFMTQLERYSDNTKYIAEALHKINPALTSVWLMAPTDNYSLPIWMKRVRCLSALGIFRHFYEYATAKVIITDGIFAWGTRNFGKQLFISTWHGSLGMKKIGTEIPVNEDNGLILLSLRQERFNIPGIMISNSVILSQIYRTGFSYKGIIWRIGYPRCDTLLENHREIRRKIRILYGLSEDTKILLYAPTFRRDVYDGKTSDTTPYDINVKATIDAITKRFGGDWVFVIRWHHFQANDKACQEKFANTTAIDMTNYPDMQELICASDAFISDYSSGIFDARMAGLPCFIFATDVEEYERVSGLVEPIESYPFPYAKDNVELIRHIENYDKTYYDNLWRKWSTSKGLVLTDHTSYDVASVINKFIAGDAHYLDGIENDCSEIIKTH